ncbi:MAG: zinc-binding dehydrogenase [Gemmatimonadaceae bacterium]|nr:zinc-binding dehydrogenase [Gemmatimonadaceae bacterium]
MSSLATPGLSMRGLTISAHGGLEQLQVRDDLPVPMLSGPDDVRVRVHAAALNRLDWWVLNGIPGVKIQPGWVLGSDGAGVVESIGSNVRDVAVGDRVIINPGIVDRNCRCEYCRDGDQPLCLSYGILGEHRPGTMAEYVVVPAANVRTIPDEIDFESAAAFPLATLTAWRMIVTRAKVQPGDSVLIWGIGGGVALAALQIAKHIGATVWVTSSSLEKLARAQAMGADFLLDHRQPDLGREIRARTGKRGVDVVIDSVGEATWSQSLVALGKRGRLVTCGGTTGPHVQVDVRRMFWNQWTLMGSTMGSDAEFDAMTALFRHGALQPPVDSVWSLAEGRQAFERLDSGAQFGKVVVRV